MINDGTGQFAQGDALGADLVTACMGASVADMNRDGYLDLYMTVQLVSIFWSMKKMDT